MKSLFYTLVAAGIDANQIGLPKFSGTGSIFNNIINLIYVAIGAVSMFYIVRGALLFVTSNGDPNSIKQARTTILIAAGSFIMASMVFGLVNFIIANVAGRNQ